MSNFDAMGKEELRAACKQASIKGWGKMNNTQMRDALKAGQAAMGIPEVVQETEAPIADPAQLSTPELVSAIKEMLKSDPTVEQLPVEDSRKSEDQVRADYIERAKGVDLTTLGVSGFEGRCPHCGVHVDNGVASHADILETSKKGAGEMKNDIVCLGCNGEWGLPIVREVRKPVVNPTGVKIEKNREEKNGVKRLSVGTICAQIWSELDRVRAASNGNTPSFKDLKALQDKHGWQRNTAVTQYQRWKEFNDLMVR